jgi:hypothetical protein
MRRGGVAKEGVSWVGRMLRDQAVPALGTVAFDVVQRLGLVQFLPSPPSPDSRYRNLGLFLSIVAAIVTSTDFSQPGHVFGLGALLTATAALILCLVPFIGARDPAFFGLGPDAFATVSMVAYLGLYVVIGILLGGGWTRIVKGSSRPPRSEGAGPEGSGGPIGQFHDSERSRASLRTLPDQRDEPDANSGLSTSLSAAE